MLVVEKVINKELKLNIYLLIGDSSIIWLNFVSFII